MHRRQFIKYSTVLFASVGAGACAVQVQSKSLNTSLGVQLFMLRESMQKSPEKTLEEIAGIGFKEVELFGFGKSLFNSDPFFGLGPRRFSEALKNNGLTAPIAHLAGSVDDEEKLAELADIVAIKRFVIAMPPEFVDRTSGRARIVGVQSLEQLDRMSERLNNEASKLSKHGIGFGYHNHNMEFKNVGGVVAFDYLMQQLDRNLVAIELDLGWVAAAGLSPVQWINKYGSRIQSVHLKEYSSSIPAGLDSTKYPIPEMSQLVLPGHGDLKFKDIFNALDSMGIKHRFLEVDLPKTPMEEAQIGFSYLSRYL